MDQIRQYLMSILAAAILCSIVVRLTEKQNVTSAIIKLTAGLFLSVTVISPFINLQIGELSTYFSALDTRTDEIIVSGQNAASKETADIILQQTESYILDKAASYGANIQVNAQISDPDTMIPDLVTLKGSISPYIKQRLQKTIAEDLGIPEENQTWISSN